MKGLSLAALVFATCAAGTIEEASERPPDPRAVLRSLPRAATSSDGFIRVVAADVPGDNLGFRGPILQFSAGLVRDLSKTFALPPLGRSTEAGLVIYAQDGRTNDARVVVRTQRRRGRIQTRVWLPSPGFSDLSALRRAVATAYFRTLVEAHRVLPVRKGTPPPLDMPSDLVEGALRQVNLQTSREDLARALGTWSQGRWKSVPLFCAATNRAPVEAGYLMGWIREKGLLPKMLPAWAAGKPFTGPALAAALTGETDPVRQDVAGDARFLRLFRKVASPGAASAEDLRVFASRLLLYPPFYDETFGSGKTYCTLREAIALAPEAAHVRSLAARKAREIPLYAIGRGERLQEASLAYRAFLLALAAGETSPGRLALLLDEADLKFEAARRAAVKGKEGTR